MAVTVSHRAQRTRSSQIRQILHLTQRDDMLSLAGGLPAPACFPVEAIEGATRAALARRGPTGPPALQYGPTEGDPTLRAVLAERFGVPVEGVLVTTGSQQALWLLAHVLGDPGDAVAVVDPTYLGAIQAFAQAELGVVAVHSDAEGPTPDSLSQRLGGGVRVAYLVPDFANPTGAVVSAARRVELAAVIDERGAVLIEDQPYRELRYDGDPAPAFADLTDRAIRVGTVSKVLAPGLRVGWIVGPPDLVAACARAKQALDLHTAGLDQLVVAHLLGDPAWFDAHLATLRAHGRRQRDALCAALERHLAGRIEVARPAGGMFVWGRAVDGVDARALLHEALAAGVAFVPGAEFAGGDPARWRDHLRLSFATLPLDAFDEAAARLAAALARVPSRRSMPGAVG